MSKKPTNLIFGVNEKPPKWMTLFMGFQHNCLFAVSLSLPVIIVREMGGSTEQAAFMISMSMIAGGLGAIIQVYPRTGSGYLCPPVCSPTNFAAAMVASKAGGLSLIFGMTLMSGIAEVLFSRIIHRLRTLFPPEVTGLIVAMVGITIIRVAILNFLGLDKFDPTIHPSELIVSISTLSLMIGLNVWSRGKLKLFCVLIGMMFGYLLSYGLGLLGDQELNKVRESSFFWFPFLHHPGWSFDLSLFIPYIIVMICSALKTVGDVTTCQKTNDSEWKRPDMANVSKGVLADGICDVTAGLFGGAGQSSSSSNVGLSIATGVTSRVIGYAAGGLLICFAFFPKVASLFAIIPKPVIGATIIFSVSFMVIAGFQIIMSRMIDARKTFIIGVSLIFGLSVDILPDVYAHIHPWMRPIFSSSLSTATVMAIFLHLIFRIGIARKVMLELVPGLDSSQKIFNLMEQSGRAWGARPEVIHKSIAVINEFFEAATEHELTKDPIRVEVSFDEFHLEVDVHYKGELIELPSVRPDPDLILSEEGAPLRLSGFLIRSYSDKITTERKGDQSHIHIHFIH
ncbi:MAG: xanthine permease [Deltaproteobacteria bacterium]|nr:xanthine permease [Deltaproteobacteria bacterium]